ncbi:MAG: hypothetical protein A3E00_15745 [Curvibacter sp. RIFCSPHIGHO2_12_FULL_63_18]|uniref:hypothetical protein n=1 Tax=Rhodoferax sp. TaxID=50421 RepID=UPI0008D209B3|nr:hypothetical protein [Rhodoferax sp.]OGO98693.1 MAG: hypothetical protein A2037_16775 [Curvibacter sp. GWA2_63_95]OGP01967.1 MAG: hypothetical protein A3E00_15745 [Curvibacter sp. RIFCSPHIGHO2_12_FULL_63_18]HCX80800.1 hypothetical protein [Rhodoferax sp.]
MSLFRWFSKKKQGLAPAAESSGLGHIDATLPFNHSGKSRSKGPHSVPGSAANRKNERLERRELLYTVVRESMTRAGLLSTSYKFKVLSLDSRGRQYLIMMDMARQNVGDPQRLADMETHIAKVAKSRHDILVTAVYWRVNEHVTTGLARSASVVPAVSTPVAPTAPRYEPLQADEVAAFKQALAAIPSPSALSAPGEIVRSGRRNPAPPSFQDTELDDRNSPLSGTQYGDLN